LELRQCRGINRKRKKKNRQFAFPNGGEVSWTSPFFVVWAGEEGDGSVMPGEGEEKKQWHKSLWRARKKGDNYFLAQEGPAGDSFVSSQQGLQVRKRKGGRRCSREEKKRKCGGKERGGKEGTRRQGGRGRLGNKGNFIFFSDLHVARSGKKNQDRLPGGKKKE